MPGAIQDLPWRNNWSADNPVEVFNQHLSLLVGHNIRGHNKDKPWFDNQCRRDFDLKHKTNLRLTRDRSLVNLEEFVRCQVRANETHTEVKHQLVTETGMIYECSKSVHKWWSTPKSAVFDSISTLPPPAGGGGGLVCESVGKFLQVK